MATSLNSDREVEPREPGLDGIIPWFGHLVAILGLQWEQPIATLADQGISDLPYAPAVV